MTRSERYNQREKAEPQRRAKHGQKRPGLEVSAGLGLGCMGAESSSWTGVSGVMASDGRKTQSNSLPM